MTRLGRWALVVGFSLFGVTASRVVLDGYTILCCPRSGTTATYYVNTTNLDGLDPATIRSELQAAFDTWTATTANYSFSYAGATTVTTVTQNGKNEIVFKNGSNGNLYGGTWWWGSSDGHISETDTEFYDASIHFYTGDAGCTGSSAMYLKDAFAHEMGHEFGLNHSTDTTATMYPTTPWCGQGNRTLASDDIAGVTFLYKPVGQATPPAAPSNLRVTGTTATAISLAWADNSSDETSFQLQRSLGDTATFTTLGTAATNAVAYTDGGLPSLTTYAYRIRSANANGSSAWSNVASGATTAVPPPPAGTIVLNASKVTIGSGQAVDLTWNYTSQRVDVYRNTAFLVTPKAGTTRYRDKVGAKGATFSGTLIYQVCMTGSSNCSNTASVSY